jgi:hypothetical protein
MVKETVLNIFFVMTISDTSDKGTTYLTLAEPFATAFKVEQ